MKVTCPSHFPAWAINKIFNEKMEEHKNVRRHQERIRLSRQIDNDCNFVFSTSLLPSFYSYQWIFLKTHTHPSVALIGGHQQCDQIWQNFASLAKVYKYLAKFWQFSSDLAKCWAHFGKFETLLGSFLLQENGQVLQNNLTIRSHWSPVFMPQPNYTHVSNRNRK